MPLRINRIPSGAPWNFGLDAEPVRFFWFWYGIPSLLIVLIPKRWSALAQGLALGQGIYVFREAMLPLAISLSSNGLLSAMLPLIGVMLAQVLLFVAALVLE